MPRAKKIKTSMSQKVVGVLTATMPAPVQKLLSRRIMSVLVILLVPALLATGLMTINWENGIPKFSINQEKAKKVEEMTVQKIQKFRDERVATPEPEAPLSSLRDRFQSNR